MDLFQVQEFEEDQKENEEEDPNVLRLRRYKEKQYLNICKETKTSTTGQTRKKVYALKNNKQNAT